MEALNGFLWIKYLVLTQSVLNLKPRTLNLGFATWRIACIPPNQVPSVVYSCTRVHFSGRGLVISTRFPKVAVTQYRSRATTIHPILGSFLFLLCPPAGGSLSLKGQYSIWERPCDCHAGVVDTSPIHAVNLQCGFLWVFSSLWALPARTLSHVWLRGLEDSLSQLDCKAPCRSQALGGFKVAVCRVTGTETCGGSWEGRSPL